MVMPRPEGKARKIAWALLGKPANLSVNYTKKERKNRRNFLAEYTSLGR